MGDTDVFADFGGTSGDCSAKGQVADFVKGGNIEIDGELPMNTSGGLLGDRHARQMPLTPLGEASCRPAPNRISRRSGASGPSRNGSTRCGSGGPTQIESRRSTCFLWRRAERRRLHRPCLRGPHDRRRIIGVKFIDSRPYADPEKAARRLMERAGLRGGAQGRAASISRGPTRPSCSATRRRPRNTRPASSMRSLKGGLSRCTKAAPTLG